MRLTFVSAFALCLDLSAAHAQPVTGQTCVDLATTVAAGLTTSLSTNELNAMRHYANCSASQTTTGATLDIAYQSFGLGAKYDNARKNAECTKEDSALSYNSTEYRNAKVVFDQGLATVNLCLEKAARSWSIVARQTGPDIVSFSVSNLSPSGADLVGIDILPANSMTCTGMPVSFPAKLTSTNYVSMTCSREAQTQMIDNVAVKTAPDATLILRLADGPFPVVLKGYTTSPFDLMRKDLAALRADVTQIQKSIYEGGEVITEAPVACPAGSYVVQVIDHTVAGGAHGYTESTTVRCKPLKFSRTTN